VLTKCFFLVVNGSPQGRRLVFRWLFEYLARSHRHSVTWTQMNYGYADGLGDGRTIVLDAEDEPERYCHQLYHRVVNGHDLVAKDVVEVSCGRGGGAAFVHRYFNPRTVTGIDIAHAAVDFCRQVHRAPGLRFIQGDAEDLPLVDESADALINVEASFCYGNINRFFAEVRRVLRPGGYFLYSDLRHVNEIEGWNEALRGSGFDVLATEDITENVARALRLDWERRAEVTQMNVPSIFRHAMQTFAGAPGTRIPSFLGVGKMRYFSFVLRKPTTNEAAAHRRQW
jgi:SAM-dependent methyltransferase